MKRILKIAALLLGLALLSIVVYFVVAARPVMGGMGAKTLCSCVFVTGRSPESVVREELQVFPGLASLDYDINRQDSSVTVSVLGRTSRAIYRKGLGCTLLADMPEAAVRAQQFRVAAPAPSNDSLPWPAGNLPHDTVMAGVDYARIDRAVDSAFYDTDPEHPVFTHAVVVLYKGQIIAERYADGFDKSSRLMGWSMTKSITNALIGLLVKEGKLAVADPAPVASWQNDERKQITINNLLQASSGLAWDESYFLPTSDFHRMFIRSDDKAAFAASRPLESAPGSFFEYSSGTTNILSRIIREKVGDRDYHAFPYEKLFHRIGMTSAIMEPDASGTFVASSYSFATARDWARFGLLFLNDGMWLGERILPEGWVAYSTTPAPAAPLRQYGAQVWLNLGDPNNPVNAEYPGLPGEAIVFDGFEKNFVVIVPSKELVVVRLGVTHNKNFSLAKLVNGTMAALP